MRHPVAAGGLAIAACAFWLLLSGAASARQASNMIVVTGQLVNGNTIVFTANGTAFKGLSFHGGSNNSIVTISDPGDSNATCNLTPTNRGGGCQFTTPVTSATIHTTWTGTMPTVVPGIVIYFDSSTGTFTAPVTPTGGKCDWTVAFLTPPGYAHSFPIDYGVVVANAGTAPCDPAPLTIKSQPNLPGLRVDTSPVAIPGLQPGESYTAHFAATETAYYELSDYFKGAHAGSLPIDLQANMPLDDDMQPVDEVDHASTKLLPETATFAQNHHVITTGCPRAIPDTCYFEFFVTIFRHQRGTSAVGQAAAVSRPLLVGTAHGTIKRGKSGPIHYTLNKTGLALLRKTRKLAVTLIGTRKQGATSTLIKGHVTLH